MLEPDQPSRGYQRPRGVLRDLAGGALAAVLLGVAVGLAWEALAPTPVVRELRGVLVSDTVPEYAAAQDGTFALLAVAAALLHGLLLMARGSGTRLPVALGAVLGGLVGSVVAWRLGVVLGPSSAVTQAETGAALRAPLELRAYGVLLVWPATVATVLFAGLLTVGMSGPRDRSRPGVGEPDQVVGRQLDVQSPATGADEDRR